MRCCERMNDADTGCVRSMPVAGSISLPMYRASISSRARSRPASVVGVRIQSMSVSSVARTYPCTFTACPPITTNGTACSDRTSKRCRSGAMMLTLVNNGDRPRLVIPPQKVGEALRVCLEHGPGSGDQFLHRLETLLGRPRPRGRGGMPLPRGEVRCARWGICRRHRLEFTIRNTPWPVGDEVST